MLISFLLQGEQKTAPAASEALRIIGSEIVLYELVSTLGGRLDGADWVLATLGRLDPALVRKHLGGDALLRRLEPMLLTARGANWLMEEEALTDMTFLLNQDL